MPGGAAGGSPWGWGDWAGRISQITAVCSTCRTVHSLNWNKQMRVVESGACMESLLRQVKCQLNPPLTLATGRSKYSSQHSSLPCRTALTLTSVCSVELAKTQELRKIARGGRLGAVPPAGLVPAFARQQKLYRGLGAG